MITTEKEFWQLIYDDMKAKEEHEQEVERSFEDEENKDNESDNSGGDDLQPND